MRTSGAELRSAVRGIISRSTWITISPTDPLGKCPYPGSLPPASPQRKGIGILGSGRFPEHIRGACPGEEVLRKRMRSPLLAGILAAGALAVGVLAAAGCGNSAPVGKTESSAAESPAEMRGSGAGEANAAGAELAGSDTRKIM